MLEAHQISGNTCSMCGYQEEILPIEDVPVGACIEYTPSNATVTVLASDSGYGSSQTFTTSDYTYGWKVFKNNSGQLDIISTESVGSLTLKGATGYARAVYTLNKMSNDYVNPEYATNGRSLGYKAGSSMEIINTTTYPLTWTNTYANGNRGFPYTDTYATDDLTVINTSINGEYPLRHTNGDVWLAGRYLYSSSSWSTFDVRATNSDGSSMIMYSSDSAGGWSQSSHSYGIRPIISLKSGLKIVGGDGTNANPYVISF